MNELDLLKKTWNQQQNFPQVSKEDIAKMIHKKSSSIVLWILIISIAEFLILNLVSVFLLNDNDKEPISQHPNLEFIFNNIDYISGAISLVFIAIFYYKYKRICIATNTKKLMQQILATKKTVNYYIGINLSIIAIIFIAVTIIIITEDNSQIEHSLIYYLIIIGLFLLICSLFFGVIWLYYKLVYGLLIKRLMKNYNELKRIDQ